METVVPRSGFALRGVAAYLRDFAIPLVAFAAGMLLPERWIDITFVVFGQAHFAMTFLYQYRGKRMNRWYLVTAGILALAATLYVVVLGELLVPMFLVVATLFSLHFAFDEITLHEETLTLQRVVTAGTFVALFVAMMLDLVFAKQVTHSIALLIAVVALCGIGVRLGTGKAPSSSERYLWIVGAVLGVLGLVFGHLHQVLAIVIILHAINWMLGYGERLKSDEKRKTRYWIESFLTLGGSVLLYALFVLAHVSFLRFLFMFVYYDAWAIAHIVLSYRFARR